jgi:hypothetical protein
MTARRVGEGGAHNWRVLTEILQGLERCPGAHFDLPLALTACSTKIFFFIPRIRIVMSLRVVHAYLGPRMSNSENKFRRNSVEIENHTNSCDIPGIPEFPGIVTKMLESMP